MKELNLAIDEFLPLRDVVFKTLRDAIIQGDLKPGERLMEVKLANELGVSRTPVREAIRKLELEGLVIMAPRRGAQVAPITKKHLTDVLEVRKALEKLSVELASDKITSQEIEEIKEKIINLKEAVKNNDVNQIVTNDVEFHDKIYEATRNAKLVQMLNNLREHMYRYRLEYIRDTDQRRALVEEHQCILDAIIRKDKEAAKKEIVSHINNQEKFILDSIKE